MKIKVLKLGSATREADLPAGSTVSDALAKVDLESSGYSLTVNGLGCGMGTSVSDHDIITLVPKVEGGAR